MLSKRPTPKTRRWVPRLSLLIGYGLLIIRFGEAFFRIVTGRETRLHVADEAADALKHKDEFKA